MSSPPLLQEILYLRLCSTHPSSDPPPPPPHLDGWLRPWIACPLVVVIFMTSVSLSYYIVNFKLPIQMLKLLISLNLIGLLDLAISPTKKDNSCLNVIQTNEQSRLYKHVGLLVRSCERSPFECHFEMHLSDYNIIHTYFT